MAVLRPQRWVLRGRALVAGALLAAAAALLPKPGSVGAVFAGPTGRAARHVSTPTTVALHALRHGKQPPWPRAKYRVQHKPLPETRPWRTDQAPIYKPQEKPGQRPGKKGKSRGALARFIKYGSVHKRMGMAPEYEEAVDTPDEESVFDGLQDPNTFTEYYNGKSFVINRKTWTWELKKRSIKDAERDGWPMSGTWSKDFKMPMEGPRGFIERETELRSEWKFLIKKYWRKHGRGHRWPNGKYIHLTRLQHIPFTVQKYGDAYATRAPWLFTPKEIANRERMKEAYKLRRYLEQEAEMARLARLKDLDVFPGEQGWRRPWQPKIDVKTLELREDPVDISDIMSRSDAK